MTGASSSAADSFTDPSHADDFVDAATSAASAQTKLDLASISTPKQANQLPTSKALIPAVHAQDVGRLTVVLDMDETLLHSRFEIITDEQFDRQHFGDEDDFRQQHKQGNSISPQAQKFLWPRRHPVDGFLYDFSFVLKPAGDCFEQQRERVFVSFRPGLKKFLIEAESRFEVILFTAAVQYYAEPVLDYIEQWLLQSRQSLHVNDPTLQLPLFRHRLYRQSTSPFARYEWAKDIRRLHRDMRRTVLVDNNADAMLATPDNAILIQDYFGIDALGRGADDSWLDKTMHLLRQLDAQTQQQNNDSSVPTSIRPRLMKQHQDGKSTVVSSAVSSQFDESGDVRPLLRRVLGFRQKCAANGQLPQSEID